MAPKTKKRFFVLLDKNNKDTSTVYSTRQNPSLAAKKAARAGHADIKLRERGTRKVRHYTGHIETVERPPTAPTWLPENPKVGKTDYQGIFYLDADGKQLDKPPVKRKPKKKGKKKKTTKKTTTKKKTESEKVAADLATA